MLKAMLRKSFVRYIIVGGFSAGVDYGTLLAVYYIAGLGLGVSATIGFLTGLVVNFLLNKFWSFNTGHSAKQTTEQAAKVAILVVFNLVVTNLVVIYLNKLNIGPAVSKVITTGMITLWNYALYKKHIFKEPEPIV